jgi:hypothetical protein
MRIVSEPSGPRGASTSSSSSTSADATTAITGTTTGSSPFSAGHERGDERLEVLGRRRTRGSGQRAADRVAGREQDVDQVAADLEPALLERAEQVLHVVRDRRPRCPARASGRSP